MKNNYSKEVTLINDNTVQVIERYELPRYRGYANGNCRYECEDVIDMIKEDCKIWVNPKGDFSTLITFDIDPDELVGDTLSADLEIYQKMLDEEFGKDKYEAFVLGAYIHSEVSFSINKVGNHVCRFDSSQLGFIGIPKDSKDCSYPANIAGNADKISNSLTSAWNGEFTEFGVIDEVSGDVIECIVTDDYTKTKEFTSKMLQKYGVDFEKVKITY